MEKLEKLINEHYSLTQRITDEFENVCNVEFKKILAKYKNDKGIIHTTNYEITEWLKENIMDEEELSRILDPIHMTEPGISGKDVLMKI